MTEPDVRVAPATRQRFQQRDKHVVILVAGTVDPTNNFPQRNDDTSRRAGSRSPIRQTPERRYWPAHEDVLNEIGAASVTEGHLWYWRDNNDFRAKFVDLRSSYTNLHLFVAHGWSGDNSIRNREIAGAYLCDRLCGGGGQNAYYAGWRDQRVFFHLMGHSHGGNVINEFTKRAATVNEWPSTWTILSVTYLSTPFFTRLHRPNIAKFDPQCRILNVFCDYDLTQRVIADFSVYQLEGALHAVESSRARALALALTFNTGVLSALTLSGPQLRGPTGAFQPDWVMEPAGARALYTEFNRFFLSLLDLLAEVDALITRLSVGVEYPTAGDLRDRITTNRVIISAGLKARIDAIITNIRTSVVTTQTQMIIASAGPTYPVTRFFQCLNVANLLEQIADLIETNPATNESTLINLICDVVMEQIEQFDDTSRNPASLFAHTPFASRIDAIDVTGHDAYDQARGRTPRFRAYVAHLEAIEARYARSRSRPDLIDLLLTIAAQTEPLRRALNGWDARIRDAVTALAVANSLGISNRSVNRIATAVLVLTGAIRVRYHGPLETSQRVEGKIVGSFDYLSRVSHSVSRRDLYPEVLEKLRAQFEVVDRTAARP